ncbi:methylmalonyl-CoA mutase family protein [Moheibacter stercoris]|uniref:Methylmalonyl-CoA mutase n=1 Tax=Moheibacter stercoris TaxID=1628251 RepID=A0ABV2LWC4_9FLAO
MSQASDFQQLSIAEWKLKVQAELAGLDYNEVLVFDTAEGIQVKPVYTEEDRNPATSQPIDTAKDWKIIGKFRPEVQQDYSYLYGFEVDSTQLESIQNLPQYLDLFISVEKPAEFLNNAENSSLKNLQYLGLDVIGNLAKTGNWYQSQEEDFALAQKALENSSFEKSILVDAALYQNAGANHVQQIALAVAHGVEYLEKLGAEAASKIYFKTAVGGNYFFEMAKLRALRKLWNLILESYETKAETFIYAETSLRNKSLLDVQNNLIRSGLEASAAIQGKADVVQVLPLDEIQGSNPFTEELASKQQLLLQKESYFDKFEDPISGSYFVENVSEIMTKNALEVFQKIEADGGFLKGLFEGSIQKMIQKSADKEQQAFDEGKIILIGVNKFKNPADQIQKIEKPTNEIRTQIQPIFPKRLAETIENKQ